MCLAVPIGMTVDPLSRTMLVVVNTIAPLVFIYSIGYMAPRRVTGAILPGWRFSSFPMLGIVLANNFVMMFIFWELVGLSSYILIGHYYSKAFGCRCLQAGLHRQSRRRLSASCSESSCSGLRPDSVRLWRDISRKCRFIEIPRATT